MDKRQVTVTSWSQILCSYMIPNYIQWRCRGVHVVWDFLSARIPKSGRRAGRKNYKWPALALHCWFRTCYRSWFVFPRPQHGLQHSSFLGKSCAACLQSIFSNGYCGHIRWSSSPVWELRDRSCGRQTKAKSLSQFERVRQPGSPVCKGAGLGELLIEKWWIAALCAQ